MENPPCTSGSIARPRDATRQAFGSAATTSSSTERTRATSDQPSQRLWLGKRVLIEQFDKIARTNDSFHEHGGIDTGHAFMRLRNGFQYGRRFFRRIGIERDHHATRIAQENGDSYF